MGRNKNKSKQSNANTVIENKNVVSSETTTKNQENQVGLIQALYDPNNGVKPRNIFIHSLCHTCKGNGNGPQESYTEINTVSTQAKAQILSTVMRCSNCRVINYCCREHQRQDWPNHKEFCRLIKKTYAKESRKFLYEGVTTFSQSDESKWLQIRHGYLTTFTNELKRPLEGYEKEMLLFPPLCFTCGVGVDFILNPCSGCNAVSFCPTHLDANEANHVHCRELKLWVDLIRFESNSGSLIRPQFNPKATATVGIDNLFLERDEISSFLQKLKISGEMETENGTRREVLLAGISDVATVPLTILWAIKLHGEKALQQKTHLVVHLLGGESEFEGCCPTKWETFLLHFLLHVKTLKIVVIGPELATENMMLTSSNQNLCSECVKKKCEIKIEQIPGMFYHEYVEQMGHAFTGPDVLCAFNCGIYRRTGFNGEDTWGPTIPLLRKGGLIVTTAYTQVEAEQDRARILDECSTLKSQVAAVKNPYRSARPQRTLVDEKKAPLMYKNQFINIFV